MNQPNVRVRRATPGDVDNIAPLIAARAAADSLPSSERVDYVFSLIVTEPNVEIYVAEVEGKVVGFLTVHYLEYLGRGGMSAMVVEVVVQEGPVETQVVAGLLQRVRQAAAARRCRRIDVYAPLDQETLISAAQRLGFVTTAQGLCAAIE